MLRMESKCMAPASSRLSVSVSKSMSDEPESMSPNPTNDIVVWMANTIVAKMATPQ